MIFNECPGGYFETCPGGSRTDFNEGKGGILSKFDCVSRGESITNYSVQGDTSSLLGNFSSKN